MTERQNIEFGLYAASLLAIKADNDTTDEIIISHCTISFCSVSQSQAELIAFNKCFKSYPLSDSWINHSIKVLEVIPKLDIK